jgi:copper chaperone CopZ
MKKFWILTLLVAAISGTASAEKKVATFTLEPKLHCANCENKVKSNLRFETGVLNVVPSVKKQNVVIKYDDAKTDAKKLAEAFKKIGYTATEVVSNDKAKK